MHMVLPASLIWLALTGCSTAGSISADSNALSSADLPALASSGDFFEYPMTNSPPGESPAEERARRSSQAAYRGDGIEINIEWCNLRQDDTGAIAHMIGAVLPSPAGGGVPPGATIWVEVVRSSGSAPGEPVDGRAAEVLAGVPTRVTVGSIDGNTVFSLSEYFRVPGANSPDGLACRATVREADQE